MDSSESIKALTAALVAFQTAVGPVTKTKTGKISGISKSGKPYDYEYRYADLSDQREHVREALGKNDLYVSQDVSSDGAAVAIQTMLAHTSGEWLKTGWLTISTDGSAQAVGSAATYGRRYQYAGALGLAAEEDDDGKTATERATAKASKGESDTFTMPFGKYKGLTLAEIQAKDHPYLAWLNENLGFKDDGTEDAKYADSNAKVRAEALRLYEEAMQGVLEDMQAEREQLADGEGVPVDPDGVPLLMP